MNETTRIKTIHETTRIKTTHIGVPYKCHSLPSSLLLEPSLPPAGIMTVPDPSSGLKAKYRICFSDGTTIMPGDYIIAPMRKDEFDYRILDFDLCNSSNKKQITPTTIDRRLDFDL